MIFSQKAIFGLLLIAKSVAIDYQNFEIKADSNYDGDAASKMDYTDISNTDIDDSNADDFDYDNSLSMDSLEESNSELFFEEDFEVEERGKLPKNSIAIDYEDPTDYSNAIDANGKEDVISPDSSEDPYEDFVQIDKEMRSNKGSDINVGYIRGSNFIDTLEEDSFNYSDGVDDGPDNRSGGGRTFTPIKLVVQHYGRSDGWRINMHPRKMADINGDGKADIIGFGDFGVYTSLSLGNGSFTSPKLTVHAYGYYEGDWRTDKHPRMMADVNGDGCADIVGFGNGGVYTSLSKGNGHFTPPKLVVQNYGYIEGGWRMNMHPRMMADINGDGKADIIGFGNSGVYTSLSLGNGSFTSPKLTVHAYAYDEGHWRTDKHPRMMADVNGDGCADIVGFGNGGVYTSLSKGNGHFTPPKLYVQNYEYSNGGWRMNKHPRMMADINGDGKADIIGFGDPGVYTSLSLGNGSFTPMKLTVHAYGYKKGNWRTDKHPRMMADINGDGCADIVGFGNDGVYISLSNGNGTFKSPELQVNNFGYTKGGWRTNLHTRFVIDINGDKKADVVGFGNPGVYTALRI